MLQQVCFLVAGIGLFLAGKWLGRNAKKVYATYARVLGSGAFPPTGPKHNRSLTFFHQFGTVVQLVGAVSMLMAIYSLITGR